MVLVVEEVPGELFLKTYFIVTSFQVEGLCAQDVLDFYRARGTMEGHIGEMKFVIAGRLSRTNRTKRRYARQDIARRAAPVDPEHVNAAMLCLPGAQLQPLEHVPELGRAVALHRRACRDTPASGTCAAPRSWARGSVRQACSSGPVRGRSA